MFNNRAYKFLGAAMSLAVLATSSFAKEFTVSDLEKMVRELEAVAVQNGAYKWPIKCNIIKDDKVVNAHATYIPGKAGETPQALMEVYTGLVIAADYDERLIRAVVAHEVAHLSKGHVKSASYRARDLQHFWVRQIEHEADIYGAELLQKIGKPKQDMVDMLMFLDGLNARKGDWLGRLTADHATSKARAAKISADPGLFKSLVQFDIGLVFMESRRYQLAAEMFEVAAKMEPRLKEAWTNRGQSLLLKYWDGLPGAFVARSFRPDFGSFILTPAAVAKGNEITDQNRGMYRDAIAAIEESIQKSGTDRDRELLAIAQILNPDVDKATIQNGIDSLAKLTPANNEVKFRYINNQAVGYVAMGDPSKGFTMIAAEWRINTAKSAAAAENLGRFRIAKGGRTASDLKLSQGVLKFWLKSTPRTSPAYGTVHEGYALICGELNEKPEDIESAPAFLNPAVSIVHNGKESGVLVGLDKFIAAYGKAQLLVRFLAEYDDLFRLHWNDGAFSLIAEGDKALRVTSYVAGDSMTLHAADPTVQTQYRVEVGMSVADVKWFNLNGGKPRLLTGKTGLETWNMFPALNFGVLITDGKIAGITVSDYAATEKDEK